MAKPEHSTDAIQLITQGFHWAWIIILGLASWLGKKLYETAITNKFQDFNDRLIAVDAKQDAQFQAMMAIKEDLAYIKGKFEDK